MNTQTRHQYITPWLTGFCSASLSSIWWPVLPSLDHVVIALLASHTLFLCSSLRANRLGKMRCGICGVMAGTVWMASVGHWYYDWQLPQDKIHQDVIITGTITSSHCRDSYSLYTVRLRQVDKQSPGYWRYAQLYDGRAERCLPRSLSFRGVAKLMPAYGRANPLSVNRQQYFASAGIVVTGTLTDITSSDLKPTLHDRVSRYIQQFSLSHGRWLMALVAGNRSLLTDQDWTLLKRTGTGHLFSISGFHLGVIAMISLPLVSATAVMVMRLLCRGPPAYNIRPFVTIGVLALTLLYVMMSTSQLPAMRAWIVLSIAALLYLTHRYWSGVATALLMLFMVIVVRPLSVLTASFYLSVCAVMIIWYVLWRWQLGRMAWYQSLWRMQLVLSFAMLPVTVGWFSSFPMSGALINLVMVPWVSLLLPVLLLLCAGAASGFSPLALMRVANILMDSTIRVLTWLDSALADAQTLVLPPLALLSLFAAAGLLTLPRFRYQRLIGSIFLVPIVATMMPSNPNNWYVHVLDAGQGTALIIQRGSRALIVDTGAQYNGYAATVESAMIPLLRSLRLKVDGVIISHSDNDHAGGSAALTRFLSSQAQFPRWFLPQQGCQRGKQLQWQSLTLSFVWPPPDETGSRNHLSCVVVISDGSEHVLLPGDIERTAEYALLAMQTQLSADVMLAPHHGSNTSSTGVLIDRVSPQHVVFTQRYAHRWGFPHQAVVRRYQARDVRTWRSSEHGYIKVIFEPGEQPHVVGFRTYLNRRWYLPSRRLKQGN